MFRSVDKIDKVSKADIRRVAGKAFVEKNRTVAMIENEAPKPASGAAGEPQKGNPQKKENR